MDTPNQGFVYWPVGTGDSALVRLTTDRNLQVDLNDSGCEDNDCWAVVDQLVADLPQRNGLPYLSCFVLTHPDRDHVTGFKRLLDQVTIGELWFSPRIFWEYKNGDKDALCDDAIAFLEEAERRVTLAMETDDELGDGDRVRIIGYCDVIQDYYADFPTDLITVPGDDLSLVDGEDLSGVFRAFIHSPFKDDSAGDRNETSVGMQVTLMNGQAVGSAMFLGDLGYETLCKVFKKVLDGDDDPNVVWDLYLATHHCSKGAMYTRENGTDVLHQDILDAVQGSGKPFGRIILSCNPVPATDEDGANPPHAKAKARYEGIAPSRVTCTMDCAEDDKPVPLIFELTSEGLKPVVSDSRSKSKVPVAAAVAAVREIAAPPSAPRTFGRR